MTTVDPAELVSFVATGDSFTEGLEDDLGEFGRHRGIQVRPPKLCRTLERAILVEDNALVDQGGPGQEVGKLRGRAPIFSEVHHRFKRPNSW